MKKHTGADVDVHVRQRRSMPLDEGAVLGLRTQKNLAACLFLWIFQQTNFIHFKSLKVPLSLALFCLVYGRRNGQGRGPESQT